MATGMEAIDRYFLESGGSHYAHVAREAARGTITIDGSSARVSRTDRTSLRVVRHAGRWTLDSLGLKPAIASDAILAHCSNGTGPSVGLRTSASPTARKNEKDRAVDYLIEVLRRDPDRKHATVRGFVMKAISILDNGCDRRSARRLDRALKASPVCRQLRKTGLAGLEPVVRS